MPVSQELQPLPWQRQTQLLNVTNDVNRLGIGLVHVTGEIQAVDIEISGQLQTLFFLEESSSRLSGLAESLVQTSDQAKFFLAQTLRGTVTSERQVHNSTRDIRALVDLVHGLSRGLDDFEKSLDRVSEVTGEICRVARSSRMLALNATIESSRAGEAGKGFAVVANEVKILSVQAAAVASNVQSTIEELQQEARSLLSQSDSAGATATLVLEATDRIRSSVEGIGGLMVRLQEQTVPIQVASASIQGGCRSLDSCLHQVSQRISACSSDLKASLDEIQEVGQASQTLINLAAQLNVTTCDAPFVAAVQNAARRISALLGEALRNHELSRTDLFESAYQAIPGTTPQQFISPFTEVIEEAFPGLIGMEPTNRLFQHAMVIDGNGYIPIWISQEPDPNRPRQVNSNRLMSKDRVALAACRNREQFLLQLYRRNEGGKSVVVKDASAPIEVHGEHWGAVRIGYRIAPEDLP